jgi:hypothetical protein
MMSHARSHEQVSRLNTGRFEAQSLFQQALWRGVLYRTFARLRGQPVFLSTCPRPRIGHERFQIVPLARIQGTLGRAGDFDAHFYPIHERTAERWVTIAQLHMMGHSLPPVKLIEHDGVYYVMDGHHRISVARMLGVDEIEAVVA